MAPSTRRIVRDYVLTILVAAGVALLIRGFLIEAYKIPNSAMKPTLVSGDTIFVGKWLSWLNSQSFPERGDVIVYADMIPPSTVPLDYIKRVVGVAGDSVGMQDGMVILNGKKLAQDSFRSSPCTREVTPEGRAYPICRNYPLIENFGPEKVPSGSVFVVGDSRSTSEKKKSKGWGIIPRSAIKGKALWIWLSIDSEPGTQSGRPWLPQFRLDRMFQRIQ